MVPGRLSRPAKNSRRVATIATLVLAALLLAACGTEEETTPIACQEGSSVYAEALAAAPGEVLLEGEAPISTCLTEAQPAGPLEEVGTAMLDTASDLNAEARADPTGPAAVRLGYLIGAARRGAADTGGIHADLIRRLETAALYSPRGRPLPPRVVADFHRGLAAGRESG